MTRTVTFTAPVLVTRSPACRMLTALSSPLPLSSGTSAVGAFTLSDGYGQATPRDTLLAGATGWSRAVLLSKQRCRDGWMTRNSAACQS